jgi:hypothetical protein
MSICKICGKETDNNDPYCGECIDAFCNEPFDDVRQLRECPSCGYLTTNQNGPCRLCMEAKTEEMRR